MNNNKENIYCDESDNIFNALNNSLHNSLYSYVVWTWVTCLYFVMRNTLWHVKICHDAKVVFWLLKETTTRSSDFMKIPLSVVVFTFYIHNAMWDKFQPAEGSVLIIDDLLSDLY